MYGSSLLPRNRRRIRPAARRHPFVRPYLEELESRTVFDASTGVITTTSLPVLGPAFVSNINNTAVLQQGTSSPATSLLTVGGLPTNTLFPGTVSTGSVPLPAIQVAATDQAGVPGTAAPNPLSPLNNVQIEQAISPPATPPVAIQAWSPNLSQLNPVETQMASSVYPIADFVGNSSGALPLLTSQARANSGAGNGGVTGQATGLGGSSGPALPVRPAAGDTGGVEDELLDALRGISRLDDLSGPDKPAADGQQTDQGDSQKETVASQNNLFADGDWLVHRPDERIPAEVLAAAAT